MSAGEFPFFGTLFCLPKDTEEPFEKTHDNELVEN